ncbi:MAG: hypothetical protein RRY03_03375, partial [Oscillospiraceae bacterium]
IGMGWAQCLKMVKVHAGTKIDTAILYDGLACVAVTAYPAFQQHTATKKPDNKYFIKIFLHQFYIHD